ncbi:MAG: ABC transporter permease [Bacteroidales bacterium]|nr:ABC transporter permease [Bacteroidales bacterium]
MLQRFILRNFVKRPVLNFIKIIGLSLSLCGLILIAVFLNNELTFDKHFSKSDRIYRYTFTSDGFLGGKHFARTPNASFIPQLAEYFPEIESYVRLGRIRGSYLKNDEKFNKITQAFIVDSTFFEIFDVDLLIGDSKTILNKPSSLIISETYANKLFGNENPIGKILTLPKGQFNAEDMNYTVNGIMKSFPRNCHLHPDFIVSSINKNELNGWGWVYLLLNKKANPQSIKDKFLDFGAETFNMKKEDITITPHLQNIEKIHLESNKLREIEVNGNYTVIYTLSIAAFLLLFIALVNYANLTIGMSVFSNKFLYLNKISGANRKINIKHFVFEGLYTAVISLFFTALALLLFNTYLQKAYGFSITESNISFLFVFSLVFSILVILVGLLPLFNSSLGKIKSFINFSSGNKFWKKGLNSSLIVIQYTISISLIVAVMVIHLQTKYAINQGMGINSNSIVCFEDVHADVQKNFQLFKDELSKYPSIEFVSAMFEPPGGEANDMFPFELEDYISDETKPQDNMIGVFPCDFDFLNIFNLNLVAGENFSDSYFDNEGSGEYIINMAALKRLGYSNPEPIIGKEFALLFSNDVIKIPKGKIIGVVEDFHFSSLKNEIEPYVFFKRKDLWLGNFIISYKTENSVKAKKDIEQAWNKYYPNYPFKYEHIQSMYETVYKKELLQEKLLSIFTFIALFICSMGLLGLSLLITKQKTKEIGIRKVNGSSIWQIVFMLNWSLLRWIILAFALSIPLSIYSLNKWLDNFAYKINIEWWMFALAGFIAIIVSTLTISIISWNAARNNPVKALRYE